MRTVLAERGPATGHRRGEPSRPPGALTLVGRENGFVTWMDAGKLLEVAVEEHAVFSLSLSLSLSLDVYAGSFLVAGTPTGAAWPSRGGRFDEERAQRVAARVASCLHTGFERTSAKDVLYGLRQLTDVANKALSRHQRPRHRGPRPWSHFGVPVCAHRSRSRSRCRAVVGPGRAGQGGGSPPGLRYLCRRGSVPAPALRCSGPQVLEKIFQVLLDLSHRVRPDQRSVVLDQLERLRATAGAQPFDSAERRGLQMMGHQGERNLQGATRTGGA
ncbi:Predicted membrane protein [Nocardioides psychrotolerans]|uniref:Predicted membrane protein n=1 Tax=Nocardioides psychrotolerans TaxID=1005945 RepID=A0A1I3QMB9_9ACTN|nr:Predicted membrane protein [Nocardioides psychrotolerans]